MLFILTDLLKIIASHEDKNFMGSQNLSLIIAPNILRPKYETPQTTISDARATFDIVNILIVNHDNFVSTSTSVRDTLEIQRKLEGNYSQIKKVSLKVLDDLTKEMNIHESDLSSLSDNIVNGQISYKEFSDTVFSKSEFRISKEKNRRVSIWKKAVPSSSAQAKAIGETIDSDEEREWASFQKDFLLKMFNLTRVKRRRYHSKFNSGKLENKSSTETNNDSNTMTVETSTVDELPSNNDNTLTDSEINCILKDLDQIFPSKT